VKRGVIARLVPEHLIFKFIGRTGVADDEAFVVFGALVHELTEHFKCRKHTCVIFVDTFAVSQDVFPENEHEIHVGTQIGRDTEGVLHGDHRGQIDVATVHEDVACGLLANPRGIVETVVQNQKRSRIDR